MAKEKKSEIIACRRNQVGGQAIIEGVMMKHGERTCIATRCDDGTVKIKENAFVSIKKKYKFFGIPIIRGVVGFIESLILSFKAINIAAESLGLEEEEESKAEKWMKKHLGIKLTDIIMIIATVLGIVLAFALFTWLPPVIVKGIEKLFGTEINRYVKAAIEGFIKIVIFIAYLASVSLMKDIRRVFQYHGAEHKSIACYERGFELTPENAKKCTRFHPRCGTSFMFVMILVGIIIGIFIPIWDNTFLRALVKLATLPLTMGIGYEFIMYAGKHDNIVTRILSAPGLWMQRITTREPNDDQLAIAICAIKSAMPEEFPDFDPSEYAIPIEQNLDHIAFTGLSDAQIKEYIRRKKGGSDKKIVYKFERDGICVDVTKVVICRTDKY